MYMDQYAYPKHRQSMRRRIQALEQETQELEDKIKLWTDSQGLLHHNYPVGAIMEGVDINTLTMKQYLALTRGNQAPSMNLLDSQGPIPGMAPAQALTAIQTMDYHSNKWHDGSSNRSVSSDSNSKGIAVIVSKLDSLCRLAEDLILTRNALSTRKLRLWR
ncbi:hypothetical protein Tco_0559294 [Tanacetum coccineum]